MHPITYTPPKYTLYPSLLAEGRTLHPSLLTDGQRCSEYNLQAPAIHHWRRPNPALSLGLAHALQLSYMDLVIGLSIPGQ